MAEYVSSAPHPSGDVDTLKRGAVLFTRAGCVECHRGRYFTNHDVIPQNEIGTQPSRAPTLAAFTRIFTDPQTYPNSLSAPLPPNPPVLDVPTDITPEKVQQLAYGLGNPAGGYKVPSLIGLYLTAPYLHDGGVAAGPEGLKQDDQGSFHATSNQLGMAGTLVQHIQPEPNASLRVLLDRCQSW